MINSRLLSGSVQTRSRLEDLLLVLGGSLVILLSAHVKITLPFTPVPLSMQSFAVLLLGFLLGSKRSLLAVLLYLAEGACGLPIFAGGASGLLYIAGPTGGYLLGFALAAYLVGAVFERSRTRSALSIFLATLAGTALIHLMGVAWLSQFVGGVGSALKLGSLPFLFGDLIVKPLLLLSGVRAAERG